MNSKERVLNAINLKDVDHVPVGFWFHFSGDEARGEGCINAHIQYYQEVDLDIVKIMSDDYFEYPVPDFIKSPHDWEKLEPLGKNHPWICGQVERAKRIVEVFGKDRAVFYNVFAPFSSIRFGYGDAESMRDLAEDPIAFMHALDVIGEDNALLSELLITEAGCDGVYYCVQGGEYDRFSEEQYRAWIRPSDLYVLEHANRYSSNNILHMCGWAGRKNRLELWQDYPVKCINWAVFVEGLTLEKGRMKFGGRCSLGGFETHWDGDHNQRGILYHGTKEELQNYTRTLILRHGKQGLMLGGDCTVDAVIDRQRLQWVVDAARSI